MKLRAPITVFFNGAYLPPGSEIDLPADEAAALIKRHGNFDGDMTLDEKDLESLKKLNLHHALTAGKTG